MRSLTLLLIATAAHALSVSDVTPDIPDLVGWVTYDQDNLAAQDDDKYTGGARVGAVFGLWTITGSYAVLTDTDHDHVRADEATLTVSRRFDGLTLGVGLLVSGDLHGDRLQSTIHTWGDDLQYDLTYSEDTARPLFVATYERHLYDFDNGLLGVDNSSSTIRWRTSVVWAYDQAQMRSGIFLAGGRWADGYTLYMEPFVLLSVGDPLSTAAAYFWPEPVSAGISVGTRGGCLHIGIVADLDHVYGHVGLVF